MARYIDAEDLCRRLTECWHTNDTEKGKSIQAVIDRVITPIVVGTPTADVAEVKHGEWICLEAEIGYFACSECDHRILRAECNYCPNCGAKMD